MAKDSRFFRGNLPQSDMSKVYQVIVGLPSQQKIYDNGKKILIKLPHGDELNHPCLNSFKEITHLEAMEICKEPIPNQ